MFYNLIKEDGLNVENVRIKNRNKIFSIIEKHQNRTNTTITVYFNQREDLKAPIRINNKKHQPI